MDADTPRPSDQIISFEEISRLNQELADNSPEDTLTWAWASYAPKIVATSSFQTQSVPLLHMIAKVTPDMPVLFLDTGFHFPETLAFRDQLAREFGLNIRVIRPEIEQHAFRTTHGELYLRNPDLCCHLNKVEPLQKALRDQVAWITGIRGDQTQHRQQAAIISLDSEGRMKICPLIDWTSKDIWRYMNQHKLPDHPLFAQGYMSIGCAPCTRPIQPGEDERSGRWSGTTKTECGIHLDLSPKVAKG